MLVCRLISYIFNFNFIFLNKNFIKSNIIDFYDNKYPFYKI